MLAVAFTGQCLARYYGGRVCIDGVRETELFHPIKCIDMCRLSKASFLYAKARRASQAVGVRRKMHRAVIGKSVIV